MQVQVSVTAILTGHEEGRLSVPSIRSFWAAIEVAEKAGLQVEPLFVLDRSDALTDAVFDRLCCGRARILRTDFGDQGAARNRAVSDAKGEYIAFFQLALGFPNPGPYAAHI